MASGGVADTGDEQDSCRVAREFEASPGLLREAVRVQPSDLVARHRLVDFIAEILRGSVHDLPAGILDGAHGATTAGCSELTDLLLEFREHMEFLGTAEEFQALISLCEFHFKNYAQYLRSDFVPVGYAEYLRQNRA